MLRIVLPALLIGVGTVLSSSTPSLVNDDGETEMICHTNNAAECYPKVFQPTKDFQPVRPDQEIPPGLHVRLNIQTGDREAKINDPNEARPDLEGLPVDSSVVLVEPEPGSERPIPAGAPKYEPVGKVKEQTGPEAAQFHEAMTTLKKGHGGNGTEYDDALETLNELSHDMYYGSLICQDLEALQSLLCTMSTEDVFFRSVASTVVPRALRAAGTISAALQNNPVALKTVQKHWPVLVETKCSSDGKAVPLGSLIFATIQPDKEVVAISGRDPGPGLVKAKLSAVSGLLKSPEIRQYFLEKDGMQEILRVLIDRDPEYHGAQVRAANLVADTFLDENMGAVPGQWPTEAASGAAHCETVGNGLKDECWDYQVGKAAAESKSDPGHWSGSLLSMLREQTEANRRGSGREAKRDEL